MYPHVVQFETRRREIERELQLIRERAEARSSSRRSQARSEAGLLVTRARRHPEITIERTLP